MLHREDNILSKFGIRKEMHIRIGEPFQLPGWTGSASYYGAATAFELATSRLHSFNMANVSWMRLKEIGTIKRFYSVYGVYYVLLHFIKSSVITKCGFIPEKRS